MTPEARAFIIQRLSDAPTKKAMRRVWDTFGRDVVTDPDIRRAAQDLAKGKPEDE